MRRDKHLRLLVTYIIFLLAANSFSSLLGEAASEKNTKKGGDQNGDQNVAAVPPAQASKLRYNHYRTTRCSKVESVVTTEVTKRSKRDPTLIAALLRLFFHDCFANKQCDASLLIKKMPKNEKTELHSGSNVGIKGLAFMDYLKTKVVESCNGSNIVSCADILALAARDAYVLASKRPAYPVLLGRLDGMVSLVKDADSLPGARTPINTIVSVFKDAGFTTEEAVILSGAHTIGEAKCKFFNDRLHNFLNTKKPDRTMDPALVEQLKKICPNMTANLESPAFLDQGTRRVFDKSYFVQVTRQRGVLQSDQNLFANAATKQFVTGLASGTEENFLSKFEKAMAKLGNLGATTNYKGNIRRVCSVLN
ncbi:cationic peroxidase 2 [Physcomitrium patens]|uniref:Peroxidase n=1 Tax=Physcomitrium patens TaxID=3218 RepID=A9RJ25_PHYPA|nr:cationic peroxidase 2-like [Physcomitrium patens]XP_024360330.1 cationic peroxidase 2-like [Physcomitrium patens]PNR30551.1 hypothetical protein PHYPA_026867 [Physcomitrium patens]|eukprot:XP_024360329.1 cationic peroxidase 2-like [Physcomitrella patens]